MIVDGMIASQLYTWNVFTPTPNPLQYTSGFIIMRNLHFRESNIAMVHVRDVLSTDCTEFEQCIIIIFAV